MTQLRRILCPLDLSETSARAFDYALMLARRHGASVAAIEVIWVGVPPAFLATAEPIITPQLVGDFTAELESFVRGKSTSDVAVTVELRQGPIVPEILDAATRLPADLIVMGTHGRSGFDRLILGSIAEKVLRKASCPVLTVPPAAEPAPAGVQDFQTILCPIDFSPASMAALEYALTLAEQAGQRLLLLHVFDWSNDRPLPKGLEVEAAAHRRQLQEDASHELQALVSDEARGWCRCEERTGIGRPYEVILKVAASEHADLIVMGVHGRNAVEIAVFGSVANQVVRHAHCPVLTVRPRS